MDWKIIFIFLVVFGIGNSVLTKVLADALPKKFSGIFYQFLFSAILALAYVLFSGNFSFGFSAILIGFVAVFNTFANYYFWKASELSLSKTTLFLPLVDVLAVVLALMILQEAKALRLFEIIGIMLCFISLKMFQSVHSAKDKARSRWFYYILMVIVIGGVSTFLLKVFSFTVSHQTFLASWYIGSFLGSILLVIAFRENPFNMEWKKALAVFPLSVCIVVTLLALYRVFELGGPASIVLPLRSVFVTIIPILIGWFFFNEKKKLVFREYIAFSLGIFGIVLILIK